MMCKKTSAIVICTTETSIIPTHYVESIISPGMFLFASENTCHDKTQKTLHINIYKLAQKKNQQLM